MGVHDDNRHEQRHEHERLQTRARAARGLTSCSSPTSRHAWLRVSNIRGGVFGSGGVLGGIGLSAYPGHAAPPAPHALAFPR